jgi:hypothetical protein
MQPEACAKGPSHSGQQRNSLSAIGLGSTLFVGRIAVFGTLESLFRSNPKYRIKPENQPSIPAVTIAAQVLKFPTFN